MSNNNAPKLVVVYKARGEAEAELVKSKLNDSGIPAIFDYEAGAPIMGLWIDGWGEYRILVPEGRQGEALAVLNRTGGPEITP